MASLLSADCPMCTCASLKPGMTKAPRRSITRVFAPSHGLMSGASTVEAFCRSSVSRVMEETATMDSPRIARAPAHAWASSIVSIFAFVRTRSAGPCAGEGVVEVWLAGVFRLAVASATEFTARATIINAAPVTPKKKVRRNRRDILGLNSGEGDGCKEQALQAHFAAAGVVPLGGGVRAAAFSAAAERDGRDVERKRNVGVGGTAFYARTIAQESIHIAQSFQQRSVIRQFAGGARTERTDDDTERFVFVVRRGHFLARAGLHGIAQSALHFIYFGFVFGTQIYFYSGARRDGIYRGAAFDHSKIVGAARIVGDGLRGKFHDAARGDVFGRGAIHRDNRGEARAVTFHQRANAAQVTFAFFADIAREDDRFRCVDARFGQSAREAGQRGEACAVVCYARSGEAIAVAFHANIGAGGKNCVQVRGQ